MRIFLFEISSLRVDSPEFTVLFSHLDEDDQARVKRFRLPEDSLISAQAWKGRAYIEDVSLVVSHRYGTFAENHFYPTIQTSKSTEKAKVEFRLNRPMSFNTSHDGPFVLFGVTRGHGSDIGVDIMEYPKDAWEVQEGISDQLVQDEKVILALPMREEERARLVTRIWTFKEAYVKAIGEGVGFGLERIWLDLKRDGEVDAVHVDGRDVKLDGWDWAFGTVEAQDGGRPYGWAVFWKKDTWVDGIERVAWEDFSKTFMSRQPTDDAWQEAGR